MAEDLDNTQKFSGKAEIYQKSRPGYAPQFFRFLRDELQVGPGWSVADVGSGTGIFTRQLLGLGVEVFAVEPNPDMRSLCQACLGQQPGFHSINGTASAISLPDRSVRMVTAAQAFHWFDGPAFRAECVRILQPAGLVCLVWNQRDPSQPVNQASASVFREYCPGFKGFSGGMAGRQEDIELFFSGHYQTRRFAHPLSYDLDGFLGRSNSASYALKAEEPNFAAFENALRTVFEDCAEGGQLVMGNETVVYFAALE